MADGGWMANGRRCRPITENDNETGVLVEKNATCDGSKH